MKQAEIFMEDTQSFREVDEALTGLVEKVINQTLVYEKFDHKVEVSVLFVDNEQIREINNDFRQIDAPTDVLSFPMLTFDNKRVIDEAGDSYLGTLVLGDIIVSLERAAAQAEEYGHSFEREVGFLVCHSTLHLLGYDHENEEERADMRMREEAVLEQLALTR
ncbi:MAG: rRNA maturation RNase YbeY [Ruminococcaceae bacterium]|nr:rRNA maturation RNase YbeY [Oscillospiraceae bacterium]